MGLFGMKKMPDDLEAMKIQFAVDSLKDHYKWICKTDDLGAFINGTNYMKDDIKQLLSYEKNIQDFL